MKAAIATPTPSREFQAAMPILMAGARENADDDNSAAVAMRSDRLQSFVESYITLRNRAQTAGATTAPR